MEKFTEDITGSKKGGGGGSFIEGENTLQAIATVRVVEVTSEGPIKGIVGGAKGIYLNNTAVQNEDGTFNFGGKVGWDQRIGLPDQPYMTGFPSASSIVSLGIEIKNAVPVVYDTPDGEVDALVVTISFPGGIAHNDTSNNRLTGTSVEFKIERRNDGGTWELADQFTIEGKQVSTYAEDHRVDRPVGEGIWQIRVSRITADNESATLKNKSYFSTVTIVQDVKETYPDVAYVGVSVDAATVGTSTVPTRSYLIDGVLIQVPTNYNPTTREYTGIWDGEFKYEWSDNPAWVIYDLLINSRYGMGDFITEDTIDRYSFYDAAVYNDELVSDGDGGDEPRFTFNYQLLVQGDAAQIINNIAATMNSNVVWIGGMVTILQDRPASVSKLITTSNVIDGMFSYVSSPLRDRITSINVTWNDPAAHYQQSVVTLNKYTTDGVFQERLEAAQDSFGFNSQDVAALGCTSEGQARRAGMWKLDTVLNQTEAVQFKMALNGYDLTLFDIIELYDENYAGAQQAGRLGIGSTATSLVLDRPVTCTSGTKVRVRLSDGTVPQVNVSQTSGSHSTLTLLSSLGESPAQYSDFIVTATLAPRQFRITKTSLDEDGNVNVEAVFHDPSKYARVEDGVTIPPPVYSGAPGSQISVPQNLTIRGFAVSEDNTVVRALNVSWERPATGIVVKYICKWQVDKGGWQQLESLSPSVEIGNAVPGTYDVSVYGVGYNNILGAKATGTYTIDVTGGGSSDLNPVTGLVDVTSGSTTFVGSDITVKWTHPSSNANITTATLRDFRVQVKTTADVVLRTLYVPYVAPGSEQQYTYTYNDNKYDGGPRRSFKITVQCRDTANNLSTATTTTFTNAAPAAPTLTVVGGYRSTTLSWPKATDADLKGYLVWGSTSNGFTPGTGNKLADLDSTSFVHSGLADGTSWYYKVAAYDTFGKDDAGTGLNLSSQQTTVTEIGASTVEYEFTGGTWQANNPGSNQVSWTAGTVMQTLGGGAGTTWSISASSASWSSGILYIYWVPGSGSFSSTTSLATAISSNGRVMATYRGGTNLEAHNGRAYTDGGLLYAQTVGANSMVANLFQSDNVLTRQLTVRDAFGNVILSSGVPLSTSYAASGLQNSNITMYGSSGTIGLSGGGGGTATGVVMPGNPITSGNIGTYMGSAAISNAYIGAAVLISMQT